MLTGARQRRRVSTGFTIIELVVVIAVITLLTALLLPAVQAARESGRRSQCANNLRQLGMAIHEHHGVYAELPISVGPWPEGPRPRAGLDGRGWIVGVLPYLEHQGLYDQLANGFDTELLAGEGLKSSACGTAMRTSLDVLHCPSDGSSRRNALDQWQWEEIEVAVTNYKGVIGDNRMGGAQSMFIGSEPDCLSTGQCNGLFFRLTYQNEIRLADIRDGTSYTFMVGEDVAAHNAHSVAFYANGDYASCHAPLNFFPKPPRPHEWWNVMSFRSRHPQGANFCYADASVRFVDESIQPSTYRAQSTRHGGELAPNH